MRARSPFESKTVLVVDEDRFTAHLMIQVLSTFQMANVFTAFSMDEAVEIISGETLLDAIICDVFTNSEQPLELIQYIRTNDELKCNELPVILFTGMTDIKSIVDARDAGVNEIITKPITPKQVIKKLMAALFEKREFVKHNNYTGPSRRRRDVENLENERRGEYGLEQDQIDEVMHEDQDIDAN